MEKIIFEDLPSTETPLNAENLNKIQENIEIAINGIVESGSNDNGNWVKFADGTMFCHGFKTISDITINTPWGALYESNWKYDFGSFPQEFIDAPSITLNQKEGATVMLQTLGLSTTATNLGSTWLYSPVTRTNEECIFSYIAIGRWK